MHEPETDRMGVALAALGRPEHDPAAARLTAVLGGEPRQVRARRVGEPARHAVRWEFGSGAVLHLSDGQIVAVGLPVATGDAGEGVDVGAWIAGVDAGATLDDLSQALGARPKFAGLKQPYFALGDGFLRCDFRDGPGWKEPGNLVGLSLSAGQPGLSIRPEDEDCPTCSELLVRDDPGAVDVPGTTAALADAVAAGGLREDPHWVPLADLVPLHTSGLMERVESQLTCTTCRRIICFTLVRDGSPTFGYHVLDEARRHPLGPIPPVELWGDADRVAAAAQAARYVDHEPGLCFLVARQGELLLQARYVISSMIDDSALIRLDEDETEAYRAGGHDYLVQLARTIHDGSPHRETSPFHDRDLFRGPDRERWRAEVSAAIRNHTWLAQQRQRAAAPPPS